MGLQKTALILDGDEQGRERLAREFQARGWAARQARGANEALALAREERPDLVLVDPGPAELAIVAQLKALYPSARVVAMGFNSVARAVDAVRRGADDYRCKPVHAAELLESRGDRARLGPPPRGPSSLALHELEHIHDVLGACHGNISAAARALGIHRRTLQRKLQKS